MRYQVILVMLFGFSAMTGLQANQKFWVSANTGLKLRSQPSRMAGHLVLMPYGVSVEFVEDSKIAETIESHAGTWWKVSFGDDIGWAFSGFLSRNQPRDARFAWNPSKTIFFVQRNREGAASECGSQMVATQCETGVYRGGKEVLRLKDQMTVEWRNDAEVVLSTGVADCAGGTTSTRAVDVTTGKETGSISWDFVNPWCGQPGKGPITYIICYNKHCVAFQTTESLIRIYLGRPDFQKADPFHGLRLLGEKQRNGEFEATPKFGSLTFQNGNENFEIDFESGRILQK